MFDDFKEELLKGIPIRYSRIVPFKKPIESINDMHSLGCWTAIDLNNFLRTERKLIW